jgi:hypothetical protein
MLRWYRPRTVTAKSFYSAVLETLTRVRGSISSSVFMDYLFCGGAMMVLDNSATWTNITRPPVSVPSVCRGCAFVGLVLQPEIVTFMDRERLAAGNGRPGAVLVAAPPQGPADPVPEIREPPDLVMWRGGRRELAGPGMARRGGSRWRSTGCGFGRRGTACTSRAARLPVLPVRSRSGFRVRALRSAGRRGAASCRMRGL